MEYKELERGISTGCSGEQLQLPSKADGARPPNLSTCPSEAIQSSRDLPPPPTASKEPSSVNVLQSSCGLAQAGPLISHLMAPGSEQGGLFACPTADNPECCDEDECQSSFEEQHEHSLASFAGDDSLNMLYCKIDRGWVPLPDWGRFLISVGFQSGALPAVQDRRCVIAAALPTRSFAGAFVLTGLIVYLAKHGVSHNADKHFEYLRTLPPNTLLRIVDGAHMRTARLAGIDEYRGEPRIKVSVLLPKKARSTKYYSRESCLELEPADGKAGKKKKKNCRNMEFTSFILNGVDMDEFLLRSATECVVVTNTTELKIEITAVPFAAGKQGPDHHGFLQDLSRVREYMPAGLAFHSSVLSFRSDKLNQRNEGASPRFVIFDGANAFIRGRAKFRKSHAIVLLDRTAPHLEEACSIISSSYFQRSEDIEVPSFGKAVPGIELTAFWD